MTTPPRMVTALLAHSSGDSTDLQVRSVPLTDLGDGDVVIAAQWSSVNYKDALASSKGGRVARIDPLIPGIDVAGTVVEQGSSGLAVGDPVLVHGYDLGVGHHGGFADHVRVPAGWVVPLPAGLTTAEAMTLGTAGFTAALSVIALEDHGARPDRGPVLVTGATGGVGSAAVAMLATRGFEVAAVTGKADQAEWLRSLGAAHVLDRSVLESTRPLQRERWAGAVDSVGGAALAAVLSAMTYGSTVAASGNTAGMELSTTVFPFILRGVTMVGIDSVQVDLARRTAVWQRLAGDLRPAALSQLATSTISLAELPDALDRIRSGGSRGRTLVYLGGSPMD